MSLHTLANHLQHAGRGDDKVLVHMTPKEVKGLQSLAMAHGGSLTINPETGLPEAGFLDSLLPTVIGAGLTIASGGALSPLMAAGITGAGYGLATGSLKKGLMAGLGAYGGAGLGAGLAEAGAETLGSGLGEFGSTAGTGTGADYNAWMGTSGGEMAGQQALTNAGTNTINSVTGGINAAPVANLSQTQGDVLASIQKMNPVPTADAVQLSSPGELLQNASRTGIESAGIHVAPEIQEAPSWLNATPKAPPSYWDKVGAGFDKATGSWEGLKSVWDKTPTGTGYGLLATGMGVMQDAQNKGTGAPEASPSYIRPYTYSVEQNPEAYAPSASTSERAYFKEPRYTALPIERVAASGGLMSLAGGGSTNATTLALPDRPPMEQATDSLAIGNNNAFPMANLRPPSYSSPTNRPLSQEVVDPSGGPEVNPYSGEPEFFANGGITRFGGGGAATIGSAEPTTSYEYTYDPETMQYTQTTTETPAARANSLGIWGGGDILHPGQGAYGGGFLNIKELAKQLEEPKPTVTTKTLGGIAQPYMPPEQVASQQGTTLTPNIQLQPIRTPEQQLGLGDFYNHMNTQLAHKAAEAEHKNMAGGGLSSLGGYSDGGRLLKGPGDGVSDSIPASIGNRQPARLADGEFVVPARIVSELGNGSTEAGARKLYAMMERVQKARGKTTGKHKVAVNSKSDKYLPA